MIAIGGRFRSPKGVKAGLKLKSEVRVLIKFVEITVWKITFPEKESLWCREEKKMPVELFKGTFRCFNYCGYNEWEISMVILGNLCFTKLSLKKLFSETVTQRCPEKQLYLKSFSRKYGWSSLVLVETGWIGYTLPQICS